MKQPVKTDITAILHNENNSADQAAKFLLLLKILLGLYLIFAIWQLFGSSLNLADDIEHLRAAYFVSLGDIPYRDFFEHHHPLLWYVLAPLISVLPHKTVVAVYVGRIICLGVSLLTGYYIYKTEKKFIGNKICALICLVLYFMVFGDITFSGLFQVKPDIFQRCCFFIGLYHLFEYFHRQQFRQLQIAAVTFTLAFLFLQTIVFQGVLLALMMVYFLYRHPQKWLDMFKAAIIPLGILGIFACALWQFDCWQSYYELNWQLNAIMAQMWFSPTMVTLLPFIVVLIAAFASALWYIKYRKTNIYLVILILLFIGEFVRCIFITRSVQHYLFMLIYAAMVAAPLICRKSALRKAFVGVAAFCIIITAFSLPKPLTKSVPFALLDKTEYGLTITPGGVFAKRPSYYWSHIPAETIHDIYFRSVADYDINELNKKYPQELIYYFPKWSAAEYQVLKNSLNAEQQEIMQKHYINPEIWHNYQKVNSFAYIK